MLLEITIFRIISNYILELFLWHKCLLRNANSGCEQHWVWPTLVHSLGCEHYKPGSGLFYAFSSKDFIFILSININDC